MNEFPKLNQDDVVQSLVQLKTIEDVQQIDKFKIDHLGKEVLMKMMDGKLEEHKLILEALYDLNSLLDDYLYDNAKIVENLYNVISLHYLSDVSNYILMSQEENSILKHIYNQEPYTEMINILDTYDLLTHQELADKLNISKSNLTNYIAKINPYDIFHTKTIVDHKKKYYYLSYKTKQFLKSNKKTSPLLMAKHFEREERTDLWSMREFSEPNYFSNVFKSLEINNNYITKFTEAIKEGETYGQQSNSVIIRQIERKQNKAI